MSRRALVVAVASLAFTACNSARKLESKAAVATCTRCHGDPARPNGAPPRDTHGGTATSSVSVGAHQSHLTGSHKIAAPVPCEACHVVPAADGRNHPDGTVQVTFGAVARPNGEDARWLRDDATCAVYCHGSTLPDRAAPPVWTEVLPDGAQLSCAMCHGAPPPAPHPNRHDCRACHPATVTEQGTIDVAGGKHLDGQVEYVLSGCTDCHGEAGRTGADPRIAAAPPVGPGGEARTSERAVGAHQAHLVAGNVSKPIACRECHVVPTSLTHADGVGQVTFGAAATRGDQPAVWDAEAATCSSTYCHGATLEGGVATAPAWTRVDGTQRRCDSCHGNPPPGHATGASCATCHPGTVGEDGAILVENGLHVNGRVDVTYHPSDWSVPSADGRWTAHGLAAAADLAGCRACHGPALDGGWVGVSCDGCHRGDTPTDWRTSCSFCHGDPNRGTDPFGGAPPSGTQRQISTSDRAVGAHQQHLQAGPVSQAVACRECHVVPDGLDHVDGVRRVAFGALATNAGAAPAWDPATITCAATYCHGATLAGGVAKQPVWTRVDGSQAACDACHGNPPPAPHPQRGDCRACHPATVTAQGTIDVPGGKHVDGVVERELHACTDCHGDAGRPSADPVVRAAPPTGPGGERDTTDLAVGAHQAHLVAGHVAKPVACAECHVVPTALEHSDGAAQVTFGPAATRDAPAAAWNPATASCAATYCHGATLQGGDAQAPVWTRVDGTQRRCGSCHGAPPPAPHPSSTACATCHPGTVRPDGSLDVAGGLHLDGLVEHQHYHADGWADPSVHGRAANAALSSCKSCHGPDLAGGVVGVSCDGCHAEGWRSSCTFCHGDPGRASSPAAPPLGTQGELDTGALAVGAHQAHLGAGPIAQPVACGACHAVPTTFDHSDGVAQVTFGPDATRGSPGAAWDEPSATCAATYCHGATLAGGLAKAPVWTVVDGAQARCDACHGAPPPPPHPTGTTCATCHPGTVRSDGTIDVAGGLHVNGAVDVQRYHPAGWTEPSAHGRAANASLSACRSCHGPDLTGGAIGVSCDTCHTAGWRTSCTFCHGDENRATNAAAPPLGTQGERATSARAVGAHQQHLAEGPMGRAVACTECHPVPTDLSHVDGARAIAFGALATKDSPAAAWDGARCSATYCHGATLADGTTPAPQWTKVDGTQAGCGACHGLPPRIPAHVGVGPDLAGCAGCHGDTTTASGAVIPASLGGKHLDGVVEVSSSHGDGWVDPASPNFHAFSANAGLAACGTCHGADLGGGPSRRACASCHGLDFTTTCTGCHGDRAKGTAAPPRATWGNTAPQAIGAHASHLGATHAIAAPLDCVACHARPADALAPGHVDGAPTVTGYTGSDPALAAAVTDPGYARSGAGASCATSYCHGATLPGGTNTRPSWTVTNGTQAACGTCHGRPPVDGPIVSGYPAHRFHTYRKNLTCQACHDGYSQTSVDPATHVNGVRDVRVRHLACAPQGCDPSVDAGCTCTEEVATIVGWDCGSCHSKFTF